MPKVVGYHRPTSVAEALDLLAQPSAAVLAGGTRVNATPSGSPVVAVDIQSLGLGGLSDLGSGRVRVGAAATLQDLVESTLLPAELRELARREEPSTLRTLATIGGTVAAGGPESELVTGLLAAEAVVAISSRSGVKEVGLEELLANCDHLVGSLVTAVTITVDGRWALARTGRTPGDQAIVSVAGRRAGDGSLRIAVSGVAPTPVLASSGARFAPTGDFRGSAAYRTHLATTLLDRVTKELAA